MAAGTGDSQFPILILASASPRRRQLLAEAGYKFTVVESDVDESTFPVEGVAVREYAERLALAKADNIARKYPDSLVIGADTVVDCQGRIIGKPADAAPHKVITGIAIVCRGRPVCLPSGQPHGVALTQKPIEMVKSDTTTVYPRKMTAEQVAAHIEGGSWRDKAGAYAIKEAGDEFVERIDGSLTN
ncbi:MAG: Maf family protein, partial [Planctomycetota bacterium]